MRYCALLLAGAALYAQSFEVASVKPSAKAVGPDYNNQIVFAPAAFSGRNVTLKRLIMEAYGVGPAQVFSGPKWLDQEEFDVEAKSAQPASREELRRMLVPLLAARFRLVIHRETREMKAYEMVVDKGGAKIQPVNEGEGRAAALDWRHFHGELSQLANLISIQLTIPMIDDPSRPAVAGGAPVPVFDKTGLAGTFDFEIDGIPHDPFNSWQHALAAIGLKLESRKLPVEGIVVDSADRTPSEN